MKTIFLIAAILLSGMHAKAQDIFFPTKEGTVLEYKSYNEKDRKIGIVRYTVLKTKSEGENTDIIYLIESLDRRSNPIFKEEKTIQIKGNKLYVDMSNFISKAALEKAGDIPAEMVTTGNAMEVPSDLKVGDVLPNSTIGINFKVGFMSIKMGAEVTDRIVESLEKIEVQAGSFEAYKITSKVVANARGIKTNSTATEWLVKGIGMVKSQDHDTNGELNSYIELVSIKE